MNVLIVLEGKFYTGRRGLNTDFAFTNEEDLHAHMEKVNGFKCVQADDIYSKPGTRFDNKKEKYGYDIVELNIFESEDVVTEKDLEKEIYKELEKEAEQEAVEEEIISDDADITQVVNEEFIVKEPIVEEVIQLDDLDIEALKQLAKEKGIKSWHLKSRESLIEDLSAIKGGPSE